MFGSSLDYILKPCLCPTLCPSNKEGTSVQEDQLNHDFWSLRPKLPETTATDTIVLADWIRGGREDTGGRGSDRKWMWKGTGCGEEK